MTHVRCNLLVHRRRAHDDPLHLLDNLRQVCDDQIRRGSLGDVHTMANTAE